MDNMMIGHLNMDGHIVRQAGFLPANLGEAGLEAGRSLPLYTRAAAPAAEMTPELTAAVERLQRAQQGGEELQRVEIVGDLAQILFHLNTSMAQFQRAIASTDTAFPVRENLEAPARLLVPVDTPVRNLLPRIPGAGLATAWRQITSLGGGWGSSYDQPGGGSSLRMFFAESGAPVDHATVYAAKSASYKLLGTFGSVTGFAMAAGANFQNQLATEKRNAILNLMLNEEFALIYGSSTATAAPWGDGANALGFDGLWTLIATGNGTPAAQVQTGVGALTTAHIDAQLKRLFTQGARDIWMLMNGQEIVSLTHLAEASGSIIRVMATASADTILGVKVTGYKHPITGEIVPIHPSRFLGAGNIIYGCQTLPDGSPAADVSVLPQVQLPELAPDQQIQGYTAQELAPTTSAPQVYPFIVTVFEVPRMKSALHFAKSSQVTAV